MSSFQFGIATVDITPPVGVTLWGYLPRKSEFVSHPLRAEALACSAGESGWILVSADVGGFTSPLTDVIRNEVAARTGLKPEQVMIAATHTHSGPCLTDALRRERSELEKEYFEQLRGKLVEVAVSAWENRNPGELLHGTTAAPDLASNRRIQTEDGSWANRWNDPEGKNTGYYDPTVELLGVRGSNGVLEALLVNYGCHPVCFNSQNTGISGDYVSYLKDALEESGKAKTVIFTAAAHANIDPRNGVQNDSDLTKKVGVELAEIVGNALSHMRPVPGYSLGAACEAWEFYTEWKIPEHLGEYVTAGGEGEKVNTGFSAFGIGELALIGLPGETVSEYREMIAGRSPFAKTVLVSLANDFVGYIPTDRIIEEGAYESMMSPLKRIEAVILEKTDSVLKKLKSNMD